MIGAAILGSSLIGAGASYAGAKKQADAAADANAVQREIYQQTREDLEPYRAAGGRGLDQYLTSVGFTEDGYVAPETPDFSLAALSKDFQTSPGYQFQMDEGRRAVENSAAARGMVGSGRTLKELTRYGQGVANQDYWNYINAQRQGLSDTYQTGQTQLDRLNNLAALGQNAAVQKANAGQNYASNVGQNTARGAAATASGYAGVSNALTGGLQQFMQYKGFNTGYNA